MFVEFIIFSVLVVLIEYNFFRKEKPVPITASTKTLEEDVQGEKNRAFSHENNDILKAQGLWYKNSELRKISNCSVLYL